VDLSTLDALLTRWRSLGHGARPSDAAAAARGLFGSNDAERRTVVGILSIAGVLQPAHLPSMRDQYVSYGDRSDAHPGGKNDWSYPAFVWNGLDGVSEDAVSFWWPRH
jgi:hypothetical protein